MLRGDTGAVGAIGRGTAQGFGVFYIPQPHLLPSPPGSSMPTRSTACGQTPSRTCRTSRCSRSTTTRSRAWPRAPSPPCGPSRPCECPRGCGAASRGDAAAGSLCGGSRSHQEVAAGHPLPSAQAPGPEPLRLRLQPEVAGGFPPRQPYRDQRCPLRQPPAPGQQAHRADQEQEVSLLG